MFPYKVDRPRVSPPVVTLGLIALNVLAWLVLEGGGFGDALPSAVCQLGLIPGEVLGLLKLGTRVPLGPGTACVIGAPHYLTVLTSMFMHGGWLHLIGNMWFLWLFGTDIEGSTGHARFLVFYLLCGIVAAATQVLVDPHSGVPMVGASGAISGVMGAYILLYPRSRVHTLLTLGFFVTTVTLPAYVMLGYWFLLQLLLGTVGLVAPAGGGVAVWAHVGGFLTGLGLIRVFLDPGLVALRVTSRDPWEGR
ncbi:MAG TPA: rhomboid family intramembrane serine protease [Gemmatimonadales bacterium]|nr:rhomboid family intramembrane serine protease [Gemmatimonadales bacterium]